MLATLILTYLAIVVVCNLCVPGQTRGPRE
jgi:hypothetical protein